MKYLITAQRVISVLLLIGLALGAVAWLPKANADTLYLGAVSKHLQPGDYNESHELLVYQGDKYMVGAFKNSFNRNVGIVTRFITVADTDQFTVNVHGGFTYGYRRCYGDGNGSRKLCGLLTPEFVYKRGNVRLGWIPMGVGDRVHILTFGVGW